MISNSTRVLLETSLSCAVPLRIMELQANYKRERYTLSSRIQETMLDYILCLECLGSDDLHPRNQGKDNKCATCEGKKYLPRCLAYSSYIGAHGDNILFKSSVKGETAKAFNILVDALARMSFFPGGVKILDMKFETPDPLAKKIRKPVLEVDSVAEFVKMIRKVEFIKKLRKVVEEE